ncbi:hypothetical protein B0H10DRAFT_1960945 [Mycena sp. CBHHK59/15]|nr:hypothetical protein B0H10DRAFT_1960945 [Mycena sp. CBHHK59/15]
MAGKEPIAISRRSQPWMLLWTRTALGIDLDMDWAPTVGTEQGSNSPYINPGSRHAEGFALANGFTTDILHNYSITCFRAPVSQEVFLLTIERETPLYGSVALLVRPGHHLGPQEDHSSAGQITADLSSTFSDAGNHGQGSELPTS